MLKKILELLRIKRNTEIIRLESDFNKVLEIYKVQGRYILDSSHANYSYGSLYKAFQFAFKQISFAHFQPQKILMLGLGAGCVLELLEKYFHTHFYKVLAIEIDPLVVEISKKYFDIQRFNNLTIKILDAKDFIEQTKETFDFIIIDLFIDLEIPEFLFDSKIIQKLQIMTTPNGAILMNTIPIKQDNKLIINELNKKGKLLILERYKNINEMIYWQNVK